MSEGITFRSSVNGFNRNQVIEYIEGLLKEKEELLKNIEELTARCGEKDAEAAKLREELEKEKEKCETCDVAQKAEAKLGAAMIEAKRFSESLVKSAEERSAAVFAAASEKATAAAIAADGISVELGKTLEKCGASVSELISELDGIKVKLGEFGVSLADAAPEKTESVFAEENTSKADTKKTTEQKNAGTYFDAAAGFEEKTSSENETDRAGNSIEKENSSVVFDKDPFTAELPTDDNSSESEIFNAPVGINKYGASDTADNSAVIDGEFEAVDGDEVRVPIFADEADDIDTDGEDAADFDDGFSPNFNFDDDGFTIKVNLDD